LVNHSSDSRLEGAALTVQIDEAGNILMSKMMRRTERDTSGKFMFTEITVLPPIPQAR